MIGFNKILFTVTDSFRPRRINLFGLGSRIRARALPKPAFSAISPKPIGHQPLLSRSLYHTNIAKLGNGDPGITL